MKRIIPTIKMMKRADMKSKEMGTLNNSIMNGTRNFVGFLGEEIMMDYLGIDSPSNTYDYDIVYNGKTIDVKTKLTTVTPKLYYDCSIAAYNIKQKCDLYAFVRVHKNLKEAWVLGLKEKQAYLDESRFLKKGDKDGNNNFTVRADCYNLPISSLIQY